MREFVSAMLCVSIDLIREISRKIKEICVIDVKISMCCVAIKWSNVVDRDAVEKSLHPGRGGDAPA